MTECGPQQRVEKVLALFRQLGGLDATIDFEPSFKAVRGHLFADRFLLGINRRDADTRRDELIDSICEKIGMPDDQLASFRHMLRDANHVYFGVETNAHTLLYKVYLEFRDQIEMQIGAVPGTGRSYPLFTGFKWDSFAPTRQAVTRYAWWPERPVPEMLECLSTIVERSQHRGLMDVVGGILNRAAEKISHRDIQFLEVTEDGNPRRSFDINLYKSGLRLEDVSAHLWSAQRHFAIPVDKFASLYQKIRNELFGHLAGGVDRENNDFLTVYYGVKQVHSSQFGSVAVVPQQRTDESD